MNQRIIDLYDRFTHGGINRREFLDRLAEIAGSGVIVIHEKHGLNPHGDGAFR